MDQRKGEGLHSVIFGVQSDVLLGEQQYLHVRFKQTIYIALRKKMFPEGTVASK
jgi:hypothetical protein